VKLLLDINVLLDVLLDRDPWSAAASRLLSAIEQKKVDGFVAVHTLPTIYYVVGRSRDRKTAVGAVSVLLGILDVAPVERSDFQQALAWEMRDFEDAVQAAAALRLEADYLVTRNARDFRAVPVRTADPPTVLALL
jgi:predicted nucleic acid-binding protein